MMFDQCEFDIRCEWGEQGLATLGPTSDAIIIVDVLSFCTCVAIAVARGARIYPYGRSDDAAIECARSMNADLAGRRGKSRYSLSPQSFMDIPAGSRVVLPSPNGSALSLAAGQASTFAGCLRNSRVTARVAMRCGKSFAVIPCGERWKQDGALRPAVEDLIGAGAIIRHLPGTQSPEAKLAVEAFRSTEGNLMSVLRGCCSGRELAEMGYTEDILLAGEVDVEACAAVLRGGAYQEAVLVDTRGG
jgi:2-phosphosulfolactate phosphatase